MKYVKIYISIKSEADIVLSDLNPKKYCLIQSGGRRKIYIYYFTSVPQTLVIGRFGNEESLWPV
jgi:hypothetical protein